MSATESKAENGRVPRFSIPYSLFPIRAIRRLFIFTILHSLFTIPASAAPMLAEVTTTEMGTWVFCLMGAAQLGLIILQIVTFTSKQRREVSFAGEPVDKEEFERRVERLERDNKAAWEKMERDRMECQASINDPIHGLGALKSAVDMNNQQVILLGAKLDRLIEKGRS
jgi:hypothetical protein